MKKILTLLLALTLVFAMTSCNGSGGSSYLKMDEEQYNNVKIKSEGVMTYAEYAAAAVGDAVVIEAYVQATQGCWFDSDDVNDYVTTAYLADLDGAYFAYKMKCSQTDAEKLTPGTKIKVSGTKTAWAGEVEINWGSTFEFVGDEDDKYVAPALDVTSLLGKDSLIKYQNQLVKFNEVTVVGIEYQGGERGKDIYLTVKYGETTATFCVESYLISPDSDVYKAVEDLVADDIITVEGYAYWYNGINTHVTKVTKK